MSNARHQSRLARITRTASWTAILLPTGCGDLHIAERAPTPPQTATLHWNVLSPGPTVSLRGVSAVSARVVWASGADGTFLRTDDGGQTWRIGRVAGCDTLDFRDLQAFDAQRAILINAGEPGRIVETADGGNVWTIRHRDDSKGVFFDSLAFWSDADGYAIGDPLDGRFLALLTHDGGRQWTAAPVLPEPLPGEACFAASGTAIAVRPPACIWVATGGGATARVFRSTDKGQSWSVADTPLAAGLSSRGIFSVAFRDATTGVIVGGDYQAPQNADAVAAYSHDGGATWRLSTRPPNGYRSCVAWVPGSQPAWIAVGPGGSDVSHDDGATWRPFSAVGFHALSVAPDGACWAVGSDGRVGRLRPIE